MRGKPRVVAADAAVTRAGVTAGMALAEARAFAADLVATPWDAAALARAALRVTTALLAASPRVAWERGDLSDLERVRNEGVWWVDAAGLGDERLLARRLLRIAQDLAAGPVHVGIADAAVAAYAATFRWPLAKGPRRLTAVVPSGRDAAFLAPFPLTLLAPDEELAATFTALGLTTVGRIAALDPAEVESRFGLEGLAAHRLARGNDPRGPSLPRDDALPSATCDLGGPVETTEQILFALRGALAAVGEQLRMKGRTARELAIVLHLDDGGTAERTVRPARPTSHADALFDHCRAALEDWTLDAPVTGFTVRVPVTAASAGEQGHLLVPRWADPAALLAAFDRIRSREGADAVAVPELRDGHLPADAGAWSVPAGEDVLRSRRGEHAASGGRRGGRRDPPRRARTGHSAAGPAPDERKAAALRVLATPEPVRIRLGRGGLQAFRHGDTWHDVTAWCGPERLAPRWWQDSDAGPRDYFTARERTGALWLLFRCAKRRGWFAEGWWD